MRYSYDCKKCGHQAEITKPVSQCRRDEPCPACGSLMHRDYQADNISFADAKATADSKYPYVSNRLPRDLPGCNHDSLGKPIIESRAHERDVMAKHNLKRE